MQSRQNLAAVIATTQKLARAVKQAFDADGVTVMQFNEPASGQTVFHLHFHVIPRFEGVSLRPHTGQMEDQAVLAANAEKIRQALSELLIEETEGCVALFPALARSHDSA